MRISEDFTDPNSLNCCHLSGQKKIDQLDKSEENNKKKSQIYYTKYKYYLNILK